MNAKRNLTEDGINGNNMTRNMKRSALGEYSVAQADVLDLQS